MDEATAIIFLSLFGFFGTLLFICSILACRIQYQPISEY